MRTFHTGGAANLAESKNNIVAGTAGIIEYRDLNAVEVTDAENHKHIVVLKRNGEIAIKDEKGREKEKQKVPYGATLMVKEGDVVRGGQEICKWDQHRTPILAEKAGRVKFEDIQEGETARAES